MTVSVFLCVFTSICIALFQDSVHANKDSEFKNDLMSSLSINDTEKSSNTTFFDQQKKITAHKNEISGECILKLLHDQAEILNLKNKYDSKMELSEDEMVEIIGENIRNFCNGKVIILNDFVDDRFSRSKRSTDKKRYQGQTQTQFVSFGSKDSNQQTKNGLAEALSQPDLSRATVSGLNGMGQAQSQSSFGDCDECSGQNSPSHPTRIDNSHTGNFQLFQPQSSVPQKQNIRPYSESNTNRFSPGLLYEGSNIGPINGQYPSTSSSLGINNGVPGKHNQVPVAGSSFDGQYPGTYLNSGNNRIPGKHDQGYVTGPSINEQYPGTYPGSGTNNRVSDKPDQEYVTGPSFDGQYPGTYPGSRTNNKVPGNQNLDDKSSLINQYPNIYTNLENNNKFPEKLDQGHSSTNGQISNPINANLPESKKPGVTDEANQNIYTVGSSPFNPNSWSYPNKVTNTPSNQQIYPDGSGFPSFPSGSAQGILAPHNTPNHNHQWTYPTSNQQVPVMTPIESQKNPTNYVPIQLINYTDQVSNGAGKLTPIIKLTSDFSNSKTSPRIVNEAIGIPSMQNENPLPWNTGGGQGFTQLNLPSLCNFIYQTCLNALTNNKKINELTSGLQNIVTPQQNNERNQFGNTKGSSVEQPSSTLYGGGINSNQLQPSYGQPQGSLGTGGSGIHQSGYPLLNGNGNSNQIHPSYNQPQHSLDSGRSGVQQSGFPSSSNNVNPNQMQAGNGQAQDSLGTGGSGVQQSEYSLSNGNVNPNQIQPGYGQIQGSLGTSIQQSQDSLGAGKSGVPQSGYPLSNGNGNPNQLQPGYVQTQGSPGTRGSSVQPSGNPLFNGNGNGNPNQVQPAYRQTQGSLNTGGIGVQSSGYPLFNGNGNGNLNQIQPGYEQSQGSLGTRGSSTQQSGYPLSNGNGNLNQIQPSYRQPQDLLGYEKSGFPSSNGNVNPNQMQPGNGQSQGSLSAGGTGVQQSGYSSSSENVNPNQVQPGYGQTQGSLGTGIQQTQDALGRGGSGVQQSGYPLSNGNGNPNQLQPGYGQTQGSPGTRGSSVQPSGYPLFNVNRNGNPNQIQNSYVPPQNSLGIGGSGVQLSGYPLSNGNENPNQLQPGYGQTQGSLDTGGSGVQQSGYPLSNGNVNPNQIQPDYGQTQGSPGTRGSSVQSSGYPLSSKNVNPNQIHPGYGLTQGSLGTELSGVQQPGYNPSGGNFYQNGPSTFQSALDGKGTLSNYPQPYGDNYYRGQQFGPGSQTRNNYPSTNPINGGQFGSDITSGGSVTPIDTEGGDAQSMTNINVDGKDTSASASAQGTSKTGMTQTQVSGTYSGTGTFSAQAQTSDSDKGAQSQIVSNTNGTTSTAQGKGGKGQAQSQVLYNADSGIALGEAQSSGINYGTNTQLQAGIKGGLADAQSTGPGSTSSQAQIGFLPYESNNDTNQKSLFKGGGTASSQGGHYSGQSQSQLFGSYKYGISYNGAAQASSGKKLQNLPKLNLNDAKSKIGQLEGSNNEMKSQSNTLQLPAQSIPNQLRSQTPPKITHINSPEQINSTLKPSDSPLEPYQSLDTDSEYDDSNDEYEDEKDETVNTKSAQTKEEPNPKQIQNIILNLDDKHDAQITRDSDNQLKDGQILDAGQTIPGTNGTKIPDGFRGRVASVAGDHTEAKAIPGGQAQTQTVLLTPGVGGLTVVDKTNFRALLGKESYIGPTSRSYNRFQTDTNGETGKFKPDDKNVQYFTKSSTCGYFSFSCNYVNGAKSGPKICKPNPPPIPCQRSN